MFPKTGMEEELGGRVVRTKGERTGLERIKILQEEVCLAGRSRNLYEQPHMVL